MNPSKKIKGLLQIDKRELITQLQSYGDLTLGAAIYCIHKEYDLKLLNQMDVEELKVCLSICKYMMGESPNLVADGLLAKKPKTTMKIIDKIVWEFRRKRGSK